MAQRNGIAFIAFGPRESVERLAPAGCRSHGTTAENVALHDLWRQRGRWKAVALLLRSELSLEQSREIFRTGGTTESTH